MSAETLGKNFFFLHSRRSILLCLLVFGISACFYASKCELRFSDLAKLFSLIIFWNEKKNLMQRIWFSRAANSCGWNSVCLEKYIHVKARFCPDWMVCLSIEINFDIVYDHANAVTDVIGECKQTCEEKKVSHFLLPSQKLKEWLAHKVLKPF